MHGGSRKEHSVFDDTALWSVLTGMKFQLGPEGKIHRPGKNRLLFLVSCSQEFPFSTELANICLYFVSLLLSLKLQQGVYNFTCFGTLQKWLVRSTLQDQSSSCGRYCGNLCRTGIDILWFPIIGRNRSRPRSVTTQHSNSSSPTMSSELGVTRGQDDAIGKSRRSCSKHLRVQTPNFSCKQSGKRNNALSGTPRIKSYIPCILHKSHRMHLRIKRRVFPSWNQVMIADSDYLQIYDICKQTGCWSNSATCRIVTPEPYGRRLQVTGRDICSLSNPAFDHWVRAVNVSCGSRSLFLVVSLKLRLYCWSELIFRRHFAPKLRSCGRQGNEARSCATFS